MDMGSSSHQSVVMHWLTRRGFRADPFQYTNAEFEVSTLPGYYIDLGTLDLLLESREPYIIYAAKGCGKTAQRQILASMCRPADPHSKQLAVHYTYDGFERTLALADGQIERVRGAQHIEAILQAGVFSLAQALDSDPAASEALHKADTRGKWQNYLERYAPDGLEPGVEEKVEKSFRRQTPSQILRGFSELVSKAGFDRGIVFVDGLDEFPETDGKPQQAAHFLEHLLGTLPIVETPGLAFRFFLPADLETVLKGQDWYRQDRLEISYIHWDTERLTKLIQQRLTFFSQERRPPYDSLTQLCDSQLAPVIHQELLNAAGWQPRAVLQTASQLIREHARQPDPPDTISLATWKRVKQSAASSPPVTPADPVQEVTAAAYTQPEEMDEPAAPLLRIDKENVKVWLGDQEIRGEFTLQDYEARVCLYERKEMLCSYNHLASVAWERPDNPLDVTKETIAASIRRIRKILYPFSDDWEYIDNLPVDREKGGYRLFPKGLARRAPTAARGRKSATAKPES